MADVSVQALLDALAQQIGALEIELTKLRLALAETEAERDVLKTETRQEGDGRDI